MEDNVKKTNTLLKVFFWTNALLAVAVLLVILYLLGPQWGKTAKPNVLFEQCSIIITLACIPLALKIFHSQYQKIQSLDRDTFIGKYLQVYTLRMLILDATIILNIAGIYIYESHNALYMTIITIFALFFCYPNKKALENKKEEINENKNNE